MSDQIRKDLKNVQARGGLAVLAAVSGISQKRLKEIIAGSEPTMIEASTINMLK